MMRDDRKLLVDGYAAKPRPKEGVTRGFHANGGAMKPASPPSKLPKAVSVVQKPKKD